MVIVRFTGFQFFPLHLRTRIICTTCRDLLPTTSFRLLLPPITVQAGTIPPGAAINRSNRYYSRDGVKEVQKERRHESVVMEVLATEEPKELTVGAKVVQAGRDFTYLIAIVAGFGLVGILFYFVGSEFFSTSSPSYIFTKALNRVKADTRVKEALGEPISGYGEATSRGRRRDLNYLEYEVDGVTYMRMKFNVSGSKRKGEAVLDLKKNERGKYELRFLFVELLGYPPKTLVLEDNR